MYFVRYKTEHLSAPWIDLASQMIHMIISGLLSHYADVIYGDGRFPNCHLIDPPC